MKKWAKQEIEIACKNENPNWDGESFDYGISCYQSALKTYEFLLKDGHSGTSIQFTKNILARLIDGKPLSVITDEDFNNTKCLDNKGYLRKRGLKSNKQCPRMSSLFRKESLTGVITYTDVDRCYGIEIDNHSNTYISRSINQIIDELFPITMPYMPSNKKFKVYTYTFLGDTKNGDFDTRAYLYVITPEGNKVEINKFQCEKDGKWVDILREEFEERKKNKILIRERFDKE